MPRLDSNTVCHSLEYAVLTLQHFGVNLAEDADIDHRKIVNWPLSIVSQAQRTGHIRCSMCLGTLNQKGSSILVPQSISQAKDRLRADSTRGGLTAR